MKTCDGVTFRYVGRKTRGASRKTRGAGCKTWGAGCKRCIAAARSWAARVHTDRASEQTVNCGRAIVVRAGHTVIRTRVLLICTGPYGHPHAVDRHPHGVIRHLHGMIRHLHELDLSSYVDKCAMKTTAGTQT